MDGKTYPPLYYKVQEMKATGVNVAEVEVGPEDMVWLLDLSEGNRILRQNEIERHVETVLANNFIIGNDAAMISTEDVLMNFHHRAYAIITAGKRVKILLRINCHPDEAKFIDTGLKRTPMDVPAFDKTVDYLNQKNVVIARMCLSDGGSSYGDRDLSNNAICEWVKKHKLLLDKVCLDFFSNRDNDKDTVIRKVTQSVVEAAFTLALYKDSNNEEALRYAGRYLLDPHAQEQRHGVNTLSKLRSELVLGKPTSAGGAARKDTYQMVCIFLDSFLNNFNDPTSKEIINKPTWRNGYVAYRKDWFPCPDVKRIKKREPVFMYHLNLAMARLPFSSLISAATIGRKMIESGYSVKSNKPEQLASKKLCRMLKASNGSLELAKDVLTTTEEDKGRRTISWMRKVAQ